MLTELYIALERVAMIHAKPGVTHNVVNRSVSLGYHKNLFFNLTNKILNGSIGITLSPKTALTTDSVKNSAKILKPVSSKTEASNNQNSQENFKLGLYKHYKGQLYQVHQVAKHSETLEDMVVYQALYDSPEYGNKAWWVRPLKMFTETVNIEGKEQPRFEYVSEPDSKLQLKNK